MSKKVTLLLEVAHYIKSSSKLLRIKHLVSCVLGHFVQTGFATHFQPVHNLLHVQPFPCSKLLQELPPGVVRQPYGAPADLPEGNGGISGGHVPPVDHLCLPQPLVRLGEGDEVTLGPGLGVEVAKPGMGIRAKVLHLAKRQNCCSSRLLL